MCNVPLFAHATIGRGSAKMGIPSVFWHQDVYSHAIGAEAKRRLGWLGWAVAAHAQRLERAISRNSEAVVAISDQFRPVHEQWGTPREHVHVIPNWGALDLSCSTPEHSGSSMTHYGWSNFFEACGACSTTPG
jgi:hypothetical protein